MSLSLEFIRPYCDHAEGLEEVYEAALRKSRELPEDYIFVETGTRSGGSALAILQAIKDSGKNRWLFTIDPYGNKPYNVGNQTTTTLDYGEDHYRTAMKAISDYAYENKLLHSHFRLKSLDWMSYFDSCEFWYNGKLMQPKFGFAYLDGDHDPKTVFNEYEWLARIPADIAVIVDDAHYLTQPLLDLGEVRNDRLFIGFDDGRKR